MGDIRAIREDSKETAPTFEDFWLLYPKRVARKDALKAWNKIEPDLYPTILTALCRWRKIWIAKGLEYVPYAATWLNGERWEDEIPTAFRSTRVEQQARPTGAAISRSPMPQFVKDLIEKMRK